MNELKFELSVLFTKTQITPYDNDEIIKEGYGILFGKEVKDEDLSKIIGEIINDQIEMYNRYVQEIPDDFEMNDRNRQGN
jgi:hypothetical protein